MARRMCGAGTLLVALAAVLASHSTRARTIDGSETTIALATADHLLGLLPNQTAPDLLEDIIEALTREDPDYWEELQAQVQVMVGAFINEYNMNQVEIYAEDLVYLVDRYLKAPVESETYPDKNEQAAALHTSIVSNRWLVEAAVYPESMILHFEDIASIHIIVLKDAAETYSVEGGEVSRWWVDLDHELDHYIGYGDSLRVSLRQWRLDMVSCSVEEGRDYDVYTARDGVTGEESTCTQLHDTTTCAAHCDLYRQHKEVEVDAFEAAKVDEVITAWQHLKEVSSGLAGGASRFYDPAHVHRH